MVTLSELKKLLAGTNLTLEDTLDNSSSHFRVGSKYYNPKETHVMRKAENS